MVQDDSNYTLSLELTGNDSEKGLKRLLNIVRLNDGLQYVRVELGADKPLVQDGKVGSGTAPRPPVQEVEPETEEPDDVQPDEEESDGPIEPMIEGVKASKVPTIGTDSDAFHVLRALRKANQPMHTPQIREIMAQDVDIEKRTSVSKTLWSLGDRGLVDKQPSDEDARMKRYSLTSKGKAALVKAEEKVDESG